MSYLVLFYNDFFGTIPKVGSYPSAPDVEFTTDRSRLREADVVVMHIFSAKWIRDAVKYPHQIWVSWSAESRTRTRLWREPEAMAAFDLHIGFHRQDDVWHPYLPPVADWEAALLRPLPTATEPVPAVLFQSANSDHSGRDAYLTALMAAMPYDSYGRFLRNRELPSDDLGWNTKMDLIGRYHFTLAFENSIEDDYVTEKFYQPLLAGSVPVYWGARNVAELAPAPDCYIDARQYAPDQLANRLREIVAHPEAYEQLRAWRKRPLSETFRQLAARAADDPFENLARLLSQKLINRPAMQHGHPSRPFGWTGLLRSKTARVGRALKRLRHPPNRP